MEVLVLQFHLLLFEITSSCVFQTVPTGLSKGISAFSELVLGLIRMVS